MISMDMRRSLSRRWGRWRLEHRSLGAVVCWLIRRTPLWILPKITKERIRFVDCSRVLHDIAWPTRLTNLKQQSGRAKPVIARAASSTTDRGIQAKHSYVTLAITTKSFAD